MKGGGSKGNDAGAQVSLYSANLYLKAFSELSGLPEGHEEMCSGSVLVNWIIAHRIDLGPSLLLDDLLAEWTSISTHRAE
jgi:hypothetical protein